MHAIEKGKSLEELSLEEYREFSQWFADDLSLSLSVDSSIAAKSAVGGTSSSRVQEALLDARSEIDRG
jgi:argininosuccinate lyase